MPRFRSYNKGKTATARVNAWVKSQAFKAAQAAKVAARAAAAVRAARQPIGLKGSKNPILKYLRRK